MLKFYLNKHGIEIAIIQDLLFLGAVDITQHTHPYANKIVFTFLLIRRFLSASNNSSKLSVENGEKMKNLHGPHSTKDVTSSSKFPSDPLIFLSCVG